MSGEAAGFRHLVDDPNHRAWTGNGTAAFVDISGFTKLSERLARKGREGAEQITEAIEKSFESILFVAYENGGSLLKFFPWGTRTEVRQLNRRY